ncbi:MAG: RNA polymerase sigma factor [Pseudomonadota bacterium]
MRGKKEQEFEALWQRHGPGVRARLVNQRLLDPAIDVDDIEQEVRIRLWRVLQTETQVNHAASYLRTVVNSALIDAVRRAQARETSRRGGEFNEQMHTGSNNEGLADPVQGQQRMQELSAAAESALQSMSANRRRAVSLRLHGLAVNEIGTLCGWSSAKARNLVYRGLEQLRSELGKRGIDLEG